ncbi:hypothetical protein [Acetomicrobium sp.]|uniref:COG1470 family protein n=1 Tax=Acetomicrobium sp. TaxID=1872099 RepID=UPI002FC7A983
MRSKRDYAIRDEATVRLSVFAVSDIKFFLESAPDTVMSGESYEIMARLANGGNATLAVVVSARSTSKYPVTFLSEEELTLSPGESAPVALLVQTPSKLAKSARHIVILEASSKEDPSVRTSLSVATEVLSQKAEIDLYHRIPTTLTHSHCAPWEKETETTQTASTWNLRARERSKKEDASALSFSFAVPTRRTRGFTAKGTNII